MTDKKSLINIMALPVRILASKAFLLWMIGGWILYYVISAIWLREAFGAFVAGIRENLFMQVPFVLFLLSGYLNLIRASRDVFRRSKIHFIAWIILTAGTLLFVTGFFMSATMRESGQRIIGEGEMIDPPWGKDSYRAIRIDPGLKDHLNSTDTASDIFAHEPKLTVMDRDSRTFEIGAFPPAKFAATYYHIVNFGIAPGVRLFEGNQVKSEGYMILRIITPGSSDYFELPRYPYRYLVSMEPEKTVQQGHMKTSQFNLKDPVFHVRVFQGKKVIAEGDPGKGIAINDVTLYFFKPTFWVLLEAVKDPGVPVMHAGLVLTVFGIPLSLLRLGVRIFRHT
jgi:hypothetical protein